MVEADGKGGLILAVEEEAEAVGWEGTRVDGGERGERIEGRGRSVSMDRT